MNEKVQGSVMAIVGLMLLLFNALSYLFGWESGHPEFTVLGLVFVPVGLKRAGKL